jgi:hypothetical protein
MADPDGDSDDVPPPSVPQERLTEWERTEASVERLYGVEGADVRGHTVVYEDRRVREAVREATDGAVDQSWRFFFATRLRFRPPLGPGVGPMMVLPMVRTEATNSFQADLTERGVEHVERGRRERTRSAGGDRLHLRQVTGAVPVPGGDVPVEGWVCVTHTDDLYVTGGAYPRTSLARALGIEVAESEQRGEDGGETGLDAHLVRDPATDREALFDLVRAVG